MRRRLLPLAALAAAFVLGISAQVLWLSSPVPGQSGPEARRETVAPGYDLTGVYYPAPDSSLAFANLRRIDLFTNEYHVGGSSRVTRTPFAPFGYLLSDMDSYELSEVGLRDGRLSFTTESRLGVSYGFDGAVLPEGDYPVKGYSADHTAKTVLVEGRMVRRLFGLKLIESVVRFTKGSGC